MTDAAMIDTLRNAAEALSLATVFAPNDSTVSELASIARDCLDAATALARRHMATEGR
jgi:hypothetical protein